jgi:uncharacterized membrane protein YccF (DUF307 family)
MRTLIAIAAVACGLLGLDGALAYSDATSAPLPIVIHCPMAAGCLQVIDGYAVVWPYGTTVVPAR